ncbi:MAG TPA: D-alanyl-D-alanine carboxypeptidase/D-alanyl-D-alanine-endopeptidase [Solirubrobacteraceae bacterium]
MPRPRRPLATAAAIICGLAATAAPAHAIDAVTLKKRLTAHSKKLGPASAGYVVDLDAGTVLFSRRATLALAPASNEKLFTTASALLKFGAAATLTTKAAAAAGLTIDETGRLGGDLFLVGGGDPSLNDVMLRGMAERLYDAGLRRVAGGVRGDESAFDKLRGSFDTNFLPDNDLGGWLGALTWGHGRAYPGGPAAVAAARLQKFLKATGVTFGKKARAAATTAGPGAKVLDRVASPPMSTLIAITNQPSDNFYAETLVKNLGMRFGSTRLGTTNGGLTVMRGKLTDLGVSAKVVDGSGLSRANRVSPREIVDLLRAMRDDPTYRASLAVPGRSGTLASRMRGTPAAGRCQAKTGTLRGVSALSGYCPAANGHTIAFSFLENGVNAVAAKRIEDRMVPNLVRYSG